MTQTTAAVTVDDLARLRGTLESSDAVVLAPITLDVVDAATSIPREVLADPWDRFIVATAVALGVTLITRDDAIRRAELVPTVW